jgi:hypothetical protein
MGISCELGRIDLNNHVHPKAKRALNDNSGEDPESISLAGTATRADGHLLRSPDPYEFKLKW